MRPLALVPLLALGCAATTPTAQCPPPAAAASAPAPPSAVAAVVGERSITVEEVDRQAALELYEARDKALERLINDQVLLAAAKRAGQEPDDFLERRLAARVPEVTVDEARAFHEQSRDRLPKELRDKPFELIQSFLIRGLTARKRQAALPDFVGDLRREARIKLLLAPPRIDVAATGPARGPADAKVTITLFSDFQCPFCNRVKGTIDELFRLYPGQLRLVFRDFPLPFHDHARGAAEAGRCADEQGKFWALHDWMFEHQDRLDAEGLTGAAKELGLDGPRFADCLASGRHGKAVDDDHTAGERAGVRGTPAFFINGIFLSGAQPLEKFRAAVDRAIER